MYEDRCLLTISAFRSHACGNRSDDPRIDKVVIAVAAVSAVEDLVVPKYRSLHVLEAKYTCVLSKSASQAVDGNALTLDLGSFFLFTAFIYALQERCNRSMRIMD